MRLLSRATQLSFPYHLTRRVSSMLVCLEKSWQRVRYGQTSAISPCLNAILNHFTFSLLHLAEAYVSLIYRVYQLCKYKRTQTLFS
jgi:hypothetical protein